MPLSFSSDDGSHPTIVAIDKDKHSASAVKWAVDHLVMSNPTLVLVHVRIKNSTNQNGVVQGSNRGLSDQDTPKVFTPFRAYSARKGIAVKEVVIEDIEVSKGLLDYINSHRVTNIVLGASSRSALSRKFWSHDVPTIINKSAPDFCTVYVISKGKQQSVRPAAKPFASSLSSTLPSSQPWSAARLSNYSESSDVSRSVYTRPEQNIVGSEMMKPKIGPSNASMDNLDVHTKEPKNSYSRSSPSDDRGLFAPLSHGSVDITTQNLDFTQVSVKDNCCSSSSWEAEMNRLKLELRQTLDMYNTACKEAVSANQTAKELHQWKMEEASRFKQARISEEAALASAEMEKAKGRAAIEAAQKAQKLAEIEAKRRKYAELKAKRETEEKNLALNDLSRSDLCYRKYTIEEIEAATKNFSNSEKIGEGGYGPVYKAKLDHTPVAIKVLRSDAAQGMKQFKQEVQVLGLMRHPNMVLLLGACPEYGCLVYEFMNNGSLEDRLFRKGNTPPIPWEIRFKIAAEIATGLLFLHQAKPEPLVHRDLKPANILLDSNYSCKISDVGLARLVPPSVADCVTQYHMTSAAGTFCYIDPEYQQTGKLGTKSDIYSLGVMLLQIITARPPMGLTHHVERAIENGTFADILDPTVPNWPMEETLNYAKLSLKCAELRKKDRPDLGSVILPELNKLKELGMNSKPSTDS
ncbi:U-box domain-containing protein 35 [Nicotiana tabacum]|uniref:U-box domain-containing protein 35 n=2 Tax=Nicotiana TaxID=4085 RepID=A0A1S4ASN9_TOBAC|nr:PREDICTED: U-box domain-containing protein 35-like [Nicotiana sylvestris]XP_016479575.1 PREDICTED: U-box domain-containing protein 35-like [Nicotiana tabacum]